MASSASHPTGGRRPASHRVVVEGRFALDDGELMTPVEVIARPRRDEPSRRGRKPFADAPRAAACSLNTSDCVGQLDRLNAIMYDAVGHRC